jgi:hypothetical protein
MQLEAFVYQNRAVLPAQRVHLPGKVQLFLLIEVQSGLNLCSFCKYCCQRDSFSKTLAIPSVHLAWILVGSRMNSPINLMELDSVWNYAGDNEHSIFLILYVCYSSYSSLRCVWMFVSLLQNMVESGHREVISILFFTTNLSQGSYTLGVLIISPPVS